MIRIFSRTQLQLAPDITLAFATRIFCNSEYLLIISTTLNDTLKKQLASCKEFGKSSIIFIPKIVAHNYVSRIVVEIFCDVKHHKTSYISISDVHVHLHLLQ